MSGKPPHDLPPEMAPETETRARTLLPDMDAIDETVQIYQQIGRKLLASLNAVQAAGLTLEITPGGPIKVCIPPMRRLS